MNAVQAQAITLTLSVPRIISRSEFVIALTVVPPLDHVTEVIAESFKMSAQVAPGITDIYVRYGTDFFRFHDRVTLTHSEIISLITPVRLQLIQQRKEAVECIYRHTGPLHRGIKNDERAIMTRRGLIPLSELTELEINSRLPLAQSLERGE